MSSTPTVPIRLQIRDFAQLFHSMVPSPFLDRDPDADAEEFILSWARKLSLSHDSLLARPYSRFTVAADVRRLVRDEFPPPASLPRLLQGSANHERA